MTLSGSRSQAQQAPLLFQTLAGGCGDITVIIVNLNVYLTYASRCYCIVHTQHSGSLKLAESDCVPVSMNTLPSLYCTIVDSQYQGKVRNTIAEVGPQVNTSIPGSVPELTSEGLCGVGRLLPFNVSGVGAPTTCDPPSLSRAPARPIAILYLPSFRRPRHPATRDIEGAPHAT